MKSSNVGEQAVQELHKRKIDELEQLVATQDKQIRQLLKMLEDWVLKLEEINERTQ